jgi:hypothetical protein
MRLALTVGAMATVLSCQCQQPQPCPTPIGPRSAPFVNGALGDSCGPKNTCASGLQCLEADYVALQDPATFWSDICSVSCADAGCPTNSFCLSNRVCAPTCGSDADCWNGQVAGHCVTTVCVFGNNDQLLSCGSFGDAGVCIGIATCTTIDAGTCAWLGCGGCAPPGWDGGGYTSCPTAPPETGGYVSCPPGYSCVDFQDYRCCSNENPCGGSRPGGWCERVPDGG